MFLGLSGSARFAFAGDQHGAHTQLAEGVVDLLFAIAAICGDGAGRPGGTAGDPLDRGGELRRVGRVALLDGVIESDAVFVVGQLGLVAELDRFPEPALGDRPGVGVVQADSAGGALGCGPGPPLPRLRSDLAGRSNQLGRGH